MPGDRQKNYLQLHFIVFIWGFTAVLGKLITLEALPLVWYRMLIAVLLVFGYAKIRHISLKYNTKTLISFILSGLVIALHWFTFFLAIKVSNVSVTLACLSCGAFFASLFESVFYGRKVIGYELVLGLIVALALGTILYGRQLIFGDDTPLFAEDPSGHKPNIVLGVIIALISCALSAFFAIINGRLAKLYNPVAITFYELAGGVFFISVYLFFNGSFSKSFFALRWSDIMWLFLLGSACTAYAQIAAVKVMKFISPYTMMLTINLEPVYGIAIALFVFKDSEAMGPSFYIGAFVILCTVIINGILKNNIRFKK
ncbi:DMT family transporter [Flavobacterium rhizosphaerae]|uniref:DMT family transporter n=1 Tax=Flavobacterium rhizosphaerae TaxID=3163298 RepID=A0ABW8YVT7_9FLAO